MIIVVMGLPGSGKSYFASRLATLIGADYINSDRVRTGLFSGTTYSQREKLMVYEEMLTRAVRAAHEDKHVVLDATFYTNEIRTMFSTALQDLDELSFIEVVADEGLIRERLRTQREDSDANYAVYMEIKEEWDPFTGDHLVLRSTDDNIDNMLDEAVKYLQEGINDTTTDR
ncbi:AAA family ATPase [Flavitalea sp. BT771]|uniref:AAA family ATPase n=1 Tax=Flavitalea sp. BT771 TaxID=3063329 RepID=UPI0026E25F0D|nr:AAA family ATPase [Flavitalea sp. BT771]MDO6429497.1 AAA family ATPase [Flavitalea sp. BT771]MDV6218375.1 AAA family ATPase [Flavitalea sp. BT771]